ncbi:glycosyl transferase [Lachnoclostridium sp. An196]|nr:glycosyl transferase [Lachnoclostridium sp. An196]
MRLSVIGLRGFPMIEGGVEKHCESLYPKLNSDIDITVYRRKLYVKSNGKYEHISFIDLPSTKIKGFETFFHSFIASIDAFFKKPDVVHYHNIGPALFSPIVKVRKIPVILTYHSANYEHEKWGIFARKLLHFSEKVALETADKIIFVNKYQMEKYTENIREKSVYIPNGVNELPRSSNVDFLNKIGVEKERYILSVGRITPEKGFDILIKAYKLAKKDEFKLVIAGGTEFENSYMKELQELSKNENVIFTGYTFGDDLYQLYSHATLYVLASYNEGFPLVLLEAMKYELDVLVSDIPATRLVDLNKEDYFKKGDFKTLSNKITEHLKAPRKRKYNLSRYDWNVIAKEMSLIFCQVAGKKND